MSSMPPRTVASNRGRAVAQANRQALLSAARPIFAARGYTAPLSAVARAAGVSQGVLYRHFPDRRALGLAVFEENFTELEGLATSVVGPECFATVWRQLVAYIVECSAIIEMVIDIRAELPAAVSDERLRLLLIEPLSRAQDAGLADPAWTSDDVLLLTRMVYGVVVTRTDPAESAEAVRRALGLIDPRLI
jgi:AcrR family transcriptional regulator